MCTTFLRFRWPDAIETLDLGNRQVFAKRRTNATLASFSFARAVTAARNTVVPSSPRSGPRIRSVRLPGVT